MTYEEHPVEDLCSSVISGGTPPTKRDDYYGGDIPWLRTQEVDFGWIHKTEKTITPDGLTSSAAKWVPENSVIVAMYGASAGRVAINKIPLTTNQACCNLIVDSQQGDYRFLYYALKNRFAALEGLAKGAAQRNLNAGQVRSFKIPCPPVSVQNHIGETLSAYDDLIENNRQRIQLLEESARLLFKEWFVDLRFPGHEHVKIVDGAPAGWERRPLADLTTKIGSGATPRGGAAAYQAEGTALIRSMNVYDYRFEDDGLAHINDDQARKLAAVSVEPLDILLNITGASVGRCCVVPERHLPARVNQHVMIIRANRNECGPHYVLHAINSHQQKQQLLSIARAGGATREALTKEVVQNISVAVATTLLLEQFEELAGTLHEQRQLLSAQNSQLARARDLLLPRLMSAELAA